MITYGISALILHTKDDIMIHHLDSNTVVWGRVDFVLIITSVQLTPYVNMPIEPENPKKCSNLLLINYFYKTNETIINYFHSLHLA